MNLDEFTLRNGYSYDIIVRPKITKIDEHFKSVDLKVRECYLKGEKKLKFFKIYSQKLCQDECFSERGK